MIINTKEIHQNTKHRVTFGKNHHIALRTKHGAAFRTNRSIAFLFMAILACTLVISVDANQHQRPLTSSTTKDAPDIRALIRTAHGQLASTGAFVNNTKNDDCPKCPSCFNCNLDMNECFNFATCQESSGRCENCPTGFGGDDCTKPLCQGLTTEYRSPPPSPTDSCSCDDGWGGVNCNVCLRDSACDTMFEPGVNGTCYQKGQVVNRHFRSCGATLPEFMRAVLPGKTNITYECERTPADPANNIEEDVSCQFQFWHDEHEQIFYCGMKDCKRDESEANMTYDCQHLDCHCVKGSKLCGSGGFDLTEILKSVVGPSRFTCEADDYHCLFSETTLNIFFTGGIALTCLTGECLRPSEVPGFKPPVKVVDLTAIIAIGVAASFFFIGLVYLFLYLVRRQASIVSSGNAAAYDVPDEWEKRMETHVPANFVFSGIKYQIGEQKVLQGISGVVQPGQLMAIMGGSGAGKSTCLDILAGKSKSGIVDGHIFVNGNEIPQAEYRNMVGFVDQEDTLLGTLTVRETLMYSALLRLPKSMSLNARKKRVQQTMEELGIDHIADRRIGIPGQRGISGGEKRRVSIAQELVTSPSILFLDEPTSGLDSYNAFVVVDTLAKLAKEYNRTVIFTIHQPRSNIFAKFDQLLLLATGQMVYSGPALEASSHFASIGYPCPMGYNTADFIIDLTMKGEDDISDTSDESTDGIASLVAGPSNSNPSKEDGRNVEPTTEAELGLDAGPSNPSANDERNPLLPPINTAMDDIEANASALNQSMASSSWTSGGPTRKHMRQHGSRGGRRSQNFHSPVPAESLAGDFGSPTPPTNIVNGSFLVEESFAHENLPGLHLVEKRIDRMATLLRASDAGERLRLEMERSIRAGRELEDDNGGMISRKVQKATFWKQTSILAGRTLLNLYRNPFLLFAHYGISIVLALFTGALFWQVTDNIAGFQNRLGFIFFICAFFGFSSLTSLELFAPERILFVRERSNGFYSALPYFISKVMFDIIPLRVIPPLLFGSITYHMVGFQDNFESMSKFLLVLVLFNLVVGSFCLVVAILFKQQAVANLAASLTMLFCMLFCGFLLNKDNIPPYLQSIQYLSFFNYAFEALISNEMKDLSLVDKNVVDIRIPGALILKEFGFNVDAYWLDVRVLGYMAISFIVLAFILLKFLLIEKR